MFKLFAQLAITTALVLTANLRILTFLDAEIPGGVSVSVVLTILWIAAVTNAFNFLDNMDGLVRRRGGRLHDRVSGRDAVHRPMVCRRGIGDAAGIDPRIPLA